MTQPPEGDPMLDTLIERRPASTDEIVAWLADVWQYFLDTGLQFSGGPADGTSAARMALIATVRHAAERVDSLLVKAEANRIAAHVLNASERYREAISCYADAISRLDALGKAEDAARTRLGYAAALMHAGSWQQALTICAEADAWFVARGDDNGHGRAMVNTGNIYHRVDEHAKALEYHFEAARVFEQCGNTGDLAVVWENIANSYSFTGEFEKSEQMYARVESIAVQQGLTTLADQARYNGAYLQYLRGRYSDAIKGFDRLGRQFEKSGSVRHAALCKMDQSEIYLQLNLPEEARMLAAEAREVFHQLGHAYEEAKAIAFMGVAETELNRFQQALQLFQIAAPLFAAENNAFWTGMLELYRAEVLLALGRHSEARFLGDSAFARFDAMNVAGQRGMALIVLGRCAVAAGDARSMAQISRQLLSLADDKRMPLLVFPAGMLRARIAELAGDLAEARRLYTQAAESIEEHRAHLHRDELRVRFMHDKQAVYESLVYLTLTGADEIASYLWCERAKSRALADLLGQHLPAIRTESNPELLNDINRLREELRNQFVLTRPDGDPPVVALSGEQVTRMERRLEHLVRQLSSGDDGFGTLFGTVPRGASEIRDALPEETTLVEYFVVRGELVVFLLSRRRLQVYRRLAVAQTIGQMAGELAFQMQKFSLGEDYVARHSANMLDAVVICLRRLFDSVVAPWIDAVDTPRLVIVPHGALHTLPLHAAFDGERYLCDRFTISYAPSAEVFHRVQALPARRAGSALLVGQADARAPAIGQEISRLAEVIPDSEVVTGPAATRTTMFERASHARIIHISTHSYFRSDNPVFSGFHLADGPVTALDLYSQSWPSELIALSGCASGVASVAGADDLMGLVRGFLYAGGRTLLMTLWNVSDAATALLTIAFYRHWLDHGDKGRALTEAMCELRREKAHPFYWAPFVLIGAQ